MSQQRNQSCSQSYKQSASAAKLLNKNLRAAKRVLGWPMTPRALSTIKNLSLEYGFSIDAGELLIIEGNWYVTHTGLLRLARRKQCRGIHVEAVESLCDSASSRFVLKATVYPTKESAGFVGYGDADPSNVSALVRGAEMRIAETRAVNRALRKAYGIGICSVEELGSRSAQPASADSPPKFPPVAVNSNGKGTSHSVRDRLCQVVRKHKLDPVLVKAYAVDFCGTQTLKEATREKIEDFVNRLAERAEKDREGLLSQLNSYAPARQEVVA